MGYAVGSAALGYLGWKSGMVGKGAWLDAAGALRKFTTRAQALGTRITLTVFHHDRDQAEDAADAAFGEINRVEDVMSLYRPGSQLSTLNRHGVLENPDPDLVHVLEMARDISRVTGGAFDVTVQPLWTVHSEAAKQGATPDPEAIRQACALVDWRQMKISLQRLELARPGMQVTLNGLAQGFAADAACRVLAAHGVEHALIDSGEIGIVGPHAVHGRWTVGIKHPRQPGSLLGIASLDGRCLSTSGDYETRFTDDFLHHHLIDGRTGRSPGELASVSVAAPTALEADALSTAAFLLGADAGMEWIASTPGADALLVTKSGRRTATPGFPFQPARQA